MTPGGALNPGLWIEATARLRAAESALMALWQGRGFSEVIPPGLLPESAARQASPDALSTRTLTARAEGQPPLALRSDFTAGLAFMAARRVESLEAPLRLCYAGAVFRQPSPDRPEGLESLQAGCERLAPAGVDLAGDAEIVRLAASSLQAIGLGGAVLELGHWGIVGPLLESIAWPVEGRAALERALNRKSLAALSDLESRHGACAESHLLAKLLHVGGRPEAVEALLPELRAAGIDGPWGALRDLEAALGREAPGLSVRLDPADVRHWTYYTGLTLKAFVPGHAYAVLSGGRYDGLFPKLGRPFGAVGFAVHLGRLVEAWTPGE